MRRPTRPTPLSSLTAGRCFTLARPPEPVDKDHDGPGPAGAAAVFARSILSADMVFKVIGPGADGVDVVDALGASGALAPTTEVVEVPRQGYERLAQRAREEDAGS